MVMAMKFRVFNNEKKVRLEDIYIDVAKYLLLLLDLP